MWHPLCYSIKSFDQTKDRLTQSAINISEGYILPYWKELLAQQLLSMYIKKLLSKRTRYVVSYVMFLEDFAQTKYCSSNDKKKCFEYDTLDRIYKFEDKQMKFGMTLGHKCFVTQFSTK